MSEKHDAGPEYLKAHDLIHDGEWKEYTLTISEVIPANTVRGADKKLIEHPILCFEKAEKRFICGKTNRKLVTYACGDANEAQWPGHKITLRACKGNWFGQQGVAALRVAPPPAGIARPFITKKDYGEPLTGQKVGPAENP